MAETEMLESEKHKVKFKPPPLDMPSGAEEEEDGPSKTPTTPGPSGTPRGEDKYSSAKEKKKIGHRRVDDQTGEVTYKKVRTSDLMGSIQLGIGNSIGSLAGLPSRDLLLQDFEVIEKVSFPMGGTNTTPSHKFGDFQFKTYAPIAFRYFRDLFNIKPDDFLSSICLEPMRELSNPGASGSIFYVSQDDQFIVKTVQHKEAEFLQKLLPGYYMNLQQNPRTLLPKFFGLFCYQSLGKNVRLLVMNNLLPSTVKMHQKYDLKGSTYKRRANRHERTKTSPTLKDLDFLEDHSEGIYLEAATYDALMKTISRDCLVLESFKIMDYSGLVGVHNIDVAMRDREGETQIDEVEEDEAEENDRKPSTSQASPSQIVLSKPDPKSRRVQRHKSMFSTWESIQADSAPIDLGEEYPAGGIPARNSKGERLLLFLGIIDILQNYRLFKKMEHTLKSVLHDGDTISVHRPSFYAQRFQDFMKAKVFKKIPSPLRHSPSRRRGRERRGTSGSVEEKHPRSSQHHADAPSQSSLTARPDLVPQESRKEAAPSRGNSSRHSQYEPPNFPPKQGLLQRQETIEGEGPGVREVKKIERLFASSPPTRVSLSEKSTEVVSLVPLSVSLSI